MFLVFVVTYIFILPIENFYLSFSKYQGGFMGFSLNGLDGIVLNYTFFLSFFFTLGGDKFKYWAMIPFYIPILLLEYFIGFFQFWLFLILALAGWVLGWGILRVWEMFAKKTT